MLNTLDGFNLQPRLSIPFDGPINVNSVNRQDVFLVRMGDTLDRCDHDVRVVGINQIVWDPETNTLHVESDEFLDQHTRYALIVTNALHDAGGNPVQATKEFRLAPIKLLCSRDPVLRSYGLELVEGLVAAYCVGVRPQDIVGASVFTTQSATATLEKIRDQIHAATPAPADFLLGTNGERTVFNLNDVTGIKVGQQISTQVGAPLNSVDFPLSLVRAVPGVGQVAFGKYSSPDYIEVPGQAYIPPVATLTGIPVVQRYNDIYFTLFLPSGTPPAGGWPVAIVGHGGGSSKDGTYGVPAFAAKMAEQGIATIGITAVGHGFGPLSTLTVTTGAGSVTLREGGRGLDQDGSTIIGSSEGWNTSVNSEHAIVSERDAIIQTDADLMQLVRVIETGVDVDGNGVGDLDPSRVYYLGISLGGIYGAPFLAVEPSVAAGVLDVMGGSRVDRRLGGSRAGNPPSGLSVAFVLDSRQPSLINNSNGQGIQYLDGLKVSAAPYFNENMPLRDGVPLTVGWADGITTQVIQSPWTNGGANYVPGSMAIQKFFDNWEWVSQPGNPVAYAPHLRKDPLPGVPAKSVIIQFAKGDPLQSNPTTTAFLRAGDLADRATYYRYDLAFPTYQQDPNHRPSMAYPHTFAALITSSIPTDITHVTVGKLALAAQQQIATFFAWDGQVIDGLADITTSDGKPVFEVPIQGPLPEGLNYTNPPSAPAGAPAQVLGTQGSGQISTDTATATLYGVPLKRSLTATYVPAGNPLSRTVMPSSALIDQALEALPPLGRLDSALDVNDLAVGLLRPARRRR